MREANLTPCSRMHRVRRLYRGPLRQRAFACLAGIGRRLYVSISHPKSCALIFSQDLGPVPYPPSAPFAQQVSLTPLSTIAKKNATGPSLQAITTLFLQMDQTSPLGTNTAITTSAPTGSLLSTAVRPHSPPLHSFHSRSQLHSSLTDSCSLIAADIFLYQTPHSPAAFPNNPGQPRYSSYLRPAYLINSGGHAWDAFAETYDDIEKEPQFIREAHLWEIRTVQRWLKDFRHWVPGK